MVQRYGSKRGETEGVDMDPYFETRIREEIRYGRVYRRSLIVVTKKGNEGKMFNDQYINKVIGMYESNYAYGEELRKGREPDWNLYLHKEFDDDSDSDDEGNEANETWEEYMNFLWQQVHPPHQEDPIIDKKSRKLLDRCPTRRKRVLPESESGSNKRKLEEQGDDLGQPLRNRSRI